MILQDYARNMAIARELEFEERARAATAAALKEMQERGETAKYSSHMRLSEADRSAKRAQEETNAVLRRCDELQVKPCVG